MRTRSPTETSDADLIARTRAGDGSAFAQLVERHERRVYSLAYRMVGRVEDARDATQDTFLSCYRNLGKFRGEAAFTTWLHRIAVNACFDLLRKRGPEPAELTESLGGMVSTDHADRTASAVDVQQALLGIPVEFRAVLVLHDVQGLPYEDIAEALDVPVGTVKSRLHRGRVALGRELGRRRSRRAKGEPRSGQAPSKRSSSAAHPGRRPPS